MEILHSVVFLIFAVGKVQSRSLRLELNSSELVSDGVGNADYQSPFLSLNSLSLNGLFSSSETCEHYYGFFPCADNVGGYLFQIVVYEYLLATGEKFVTKGSKQLFNLIGTGFFGDVFEILTMLPEILVVLISGLAESKEVAQSRVSVAAGMYAGITVFCLTLTWGICVIFGSKSFTAQNSPSQDSEAPTSRPMLIREKLSFLTKSGVTTDKETSITAGIMLLSLIPFLILQLSAIIRTSSGDRKMILIALVVSVSGLLAYFVYQIFFPWIQERSLEYMKYENLRTGFLQHMERHATGKLVTNEGTPNIAIIESFFAKVDKDGDQSVSDSELEALILEMNSGKMPVDKEYAVAEMRESFDLNQDGKITKDEFIAGCKKWIHEHEAKKSGEHGSSHSRKYLHQVVLLRWFEQRRRKIEKKRHELAKSEHLISRILEHVQKHIIETQGLLTDEGIKSFFENVDKNDNKYISKSELKELIQNIKFGKAQPDPAVVVESVMNYFDKDGDHMISDEEYVNGITRWLHNDTPLANSKDSKNLTNKFDQSTWKEVDSLVHKGKGNRSIIHKLLSWDCVKSVLQIILGVAIVSFLADPLIYSILDLSVALGLPTFYISFVIIPFALKFKLAKSAIFPASQKSLTTSSLTFSEIYGGVVMNNITGLSILLAIVYIKGLTWDYSIEVLVVLVVCAIIGLIAFFCSSYPLWTCILAFFLYPFSLVLVHFLPRIFGWD